MIPRIITILEILGVYLKKVFNSIIMQKNHLNH